MQIIPLLKSNESVITPFLATKNAAGYDITATSDPRIVGEKLYGTDYWRRINYIEYSTGIHLNTLANRSGWGTYKDENLHTFIFPRSSVRKYNLLLANSVGLVDADYRGEFLVSFKYTWQPEDVVFIEEFSMPATMKTYSANRFAMQPNIDQVYKKGDKIAQLVFAPTIHIAFELVKQLEESERGAGGHGSTDIEKKSYSEMTSEERRMNRKLPS